MLQPGFMAQGFDEFPVYVPLIKKDDIYISDQWKAAFTTFYQTLISYITQYGFVLPNLTTTQIQAIQTPQNAQMVYNITVDAPQFYQVSSGTWRTISFT